MNLGHEPPRDATPTHHIPEAELVGHVTGHNDDEALSLAFGCHLGMCSHCRDEARRLEAIGGALLEAERPQPLASSALAHALAAIDTPVVAPTAAEKRERHGLPEGLQAVQLPSMLVDRISANQVRWRYVAPGVRGLDVALTARNATATARVLRLKRGLVIPRHDHGAVELTLVLTGGLTDADGHFERGDLCMRVPGQIHVQRIDSEQDCLALVINGGSLVPQTWQGRLLRLLARP